jgi:hypothetical protein
MDKRCPSLTQKSSQARVLFRPLVENELLDKPVEQFLIPLRFEQRGKFDHWVSKWALLNAIMTKILC